MRVRLIAVVALVAFVAAIAGVFVGRTLVEPASRTGAELHGLLHDRLDLDADQRRALEPVEARFRARREQLEAEMRAENAAIAAAIEQERGPGPRVRQAVEASHRTMGAIQTLTIAHIFEMRALLRPDQARQFDAVVTRTLTEDAR